MWLSRLGTPSYIQIKRSQSEYPKVLNHQSETLSCFWSTYPQTSSTSQGLVTTAHPTDSMKLPSSRGDLARIKSTTGLWSVRPKATASGPSSPHRSDHRKSPHRDQSFLFPEQEPEKRPEHPGLLQEVAHQWALTDQLCPPHANVVNGGQWCSVSVFLLQSRQSGRLPVFLPLWYLQNILCELHRCT